MPEDDGNDDGDDDDNDDNTFESRWEDITVTPRPTGDDNVTSGSDDDDTTSEVTVRVIKNMPITVSK